MLKIIQMSIMSSLLLSIFTVANAAKIPDSALLEYDGDYGIPVTVSFQRDGSHYVITASNGITLLFDIVFESEGIIKDNQLQLASYKDIRNGKVYASAKVNGNQVVYGKLGEESSQNVSGSVMDLFTLSWQLAFNNGKLPANLTITNGKKLYRVGGMKSLGSKKFNLSGKTLNVNQYQVNRGDDLVHYAFLPQINNVPAEIQYNDGSKNYRLTLKSVIINGKTVQP